MRQVELLSSREIPRTDLVAFFSQIGVKHEENPYNLSPYFLHTGEHSVWIDLDIIEERYPEPAIDALTEQKLGGLPQTQILLHISRGPESEALAIGFACQFAEHWPCVVDNLSGRVRRIYSAQELRQLQKEGRGLWDDDQLAPFPKDEGEDKSFMHFLNENDE